ncbi:MAG: terpene cyclase/mutase family protein [Planctomycetes bacterium]|nr:terpene cyclase/mutase family protein [Planctomycetota bacterium]
MRSTSLAPSCLLALFATVATPVLLAAQQTPARKSGELFRSELDQFVGRLDAQSLVDRPQRHPLGGESTLATAQILCAMGHGHRRYHIGDGPIVRPSLAFLLGKTDADSGFGDATTTGWVVEAMQVIDPVGCRRQIEAGRARFQALGGTELPWAASVAAILAAKELPQDQGAAAQTRARSLLAAKGPLPLVEAAATMVHLAACQVANKRLDQAALAKAAPAAPAAAPAVAAAPAPAPLPANASGHGALSPAQERGLAWLSAQTKDGVGFGDAQPNLPLTAIALMALQTRPAALRSPAERAAITTGLRWLLTQQNEDGTFGDTLANYTTCAAVGALHTFDDPAVPAALQRAQRAILSFQNCEQNGYASGDRDYGSIGYGGMTRGDLSNMNFALQALQETGLPRNHEALQRALVFLQRTQNLRATNDYAGKAPDPERDGVILDTVPGDDGGACYYPGNSSAGYVVRPDDTVIARSYGSMTYALLKCYSLAGLKADDPRVAAALRWLQQNWRLDANPGAAPELGPKAAFQGLYYYYLLMAQALDSAGIDRLTVGDTAVDWRAALRTQLESVQRTDGSWRNDQNGRWMESSALLCTAYALLALAR